MALNSLPTISFADFDEETVKNEVINQYEAVSGRHLADGDPVRLFLLTIANLLILQRNLIDHTGKMNLLAYATGDYLDHLGALVDTTRIPASAAQVTIQFTLSTSNVGAVIPKGTRITTEEEKVYFATDEVLTIPSGETAGTVSASCLSTGSDGNGLSAGLLNKLVDPLPYVATVENTTTSAGGADVESDDSYRERIHEAPETFSNAGSSGAYQYWAKTANADIEDVYVYSPSAGEVKIVPLLSGGRIPEQEVLNDVLEVCSADKVRPLTDHVTAVAPTTVSYDVNVSYSIGNANKANATNIQSEVKKAVDTYILWQKSKLGRDIDPSRLNSLMVKAGAEKVSITSPVITTVNPDQIAISHNVTITFGGVNND